MTAERSGLYAGLDERCFGAKSAPCRNSGVPVPEVDDLDDTIRQIRTSIFELPE